MRIPFSSHLAIISASAFGDSEHVEDDELWFDDDNESTEGQCEFLAYRRI